MVVLAKISGEYFEDISKYCELFARVHKNYGCIFMCGGGNWFRGRGVSAAERVAVDRIGMIGTITNAIMLNNTFKTVGIESKIFSTVELDLVCKYNINDILDAVSEGKIIILAGGLGCGYISTDTAMVVRGLELGCEKVVKVSQVGGVYDEDPANNPDARLISKMSYTEALSKNAFDKSSICLAMENKIPFGVTCMEDLEAHLAGEQVGTWVG